MSSGNIIIMQIRVLPLACAATLVATAGAGAQTSTAPVAQVPGPVTSSPSSPFGAPPPPSTPLQPPPATPSSSAAPSTGGPVPASAPVLPSIEAAPLPLPSEYRLPPASRASGQAAPPRAPSASSPPSSPPSSQDAAQGPDGLRLPAPIERPLEISGQQDPVLAMGRTAGSIDGFRQAIGAAVDRNPALGEAEAAAAEAAAVRREARAGLFPTADINVTSYSTVSRAFSNDIDNIIERSRPRARTDAQLALNQTLFDFGATRSRINAGGDRMRAAAASIDDTASQIALRTIAAWYDIFTYRSLLTIGRIYFESQDARRADFARRVDVGATAQVDVARINSSLAGLQTRLARYERALANAEAQFTQLTGQAPPGTLGRAPFVGDLPASLEDARLAAANVPAVRVAADQAAAARNEASALRRDNLPYLSAGVDAGRYGVFETDRDYDIRARVTLRQRLGGAPGARIDQARARATGAAARATRIAEESARDAAIAWTDLQALNRQTSSLEQSYLAARQSRDAIEVRFRISRGTLFDVIDANDAYFGAAAAYVESLADRDAAHYVLLARTGRLLDAIGIDSAYQQVRR